MQGFKSLMTRQEIAVRPLTVLAGINSTGKSSVMQPILLLKQTIDATYDPGPLRLDGPHVGITAIEQVLSRAQVRAEQARSFSVGITVDSRTTEFTFGRDSKSKLRTLQMSGWFFPEQQEPLAVHEDMTDTQLREMLPQRILELLVPRQPGSEELQFTILRDRSFLYFAAQARELESLLALQFGSGELKRELARVIHLPALRGNPRRTYRTAAVEEHYPGTFETYTAGVIAAWQNTGRKDKLDQLKADLQDLGLTWKVEAQQLDDTQVQLLVGRLPQARQGGAADLVNIADVGFGVSQTLPVIVALGAARPGQLVYLEQPEIHLHPRAQVRFGRLVSRALTRGVRIVVETHSALFIRSIQTLVAQGEIQASDVALHWFSRDPETGNTQVVSGELDDAGTFGDWPEDFDEVQLDTEAAYLDAAATRTPPA